MSPPRERPMLPVPELACPGKQFVEQLQRETVVGPQPRPRARELFGELLYPCQALPRLYYTAFNQLATNLLTHLDVTCNFV
ncbi:hypothetical protein SORBI_3005G210300 [Sorghum bicolor]|uniref:Uncharacterized protein n=1 Tax=Sorghum bicolor TaxID=4558 RepID=A0A1B6PTU5_SORBI|nr:hypothetical protein SORBI_3005G210300 [Sorghum bicolor]